jgi:hypothetical protein
MRGPVTAVLLLWPSEVKSNRTHPVLVAKVDHVDDERLTCSQWSEKAVNLYCTYMPTENRHSSVVGWVTKQHVTFSVKAVKSKFEEKNVLAGDVGYIELSPERHCVLLFLYKRPDAPIRRMIVRNEAQIDAIFLCPTAAPESCCSPR